MSVITSLDPDERADLIEAHRHAAALKAIVDRRFEQAGPALREDMKWLVANVADAVSDLIGLINNSEPMSFR